MNIDYRKVFLALIASIIIAIPTAAVFKNHNQEVNSERQQNSRLQLDIEKIQTEKQKSDDLLKQKADEAEKLKQENEKLQKDLQAKREKQAADAQLAAAQQKAAVAVSYGGCESFRGIVAQYDWDVNTMMRIMKAESSCIPTKHNFGDNHRTCLGSYGLMQIGCVHGYTVAYLESPENNIAAAYKIFKSQGYTAWSTY